MVVNFRSVDVGWERKIERWKAHTRAIESRFLEVSRPADFSSGVASGHRAIHCTRHPLPSRRFKMHTRRCRIKAGIEMRMGRG